MRSNDAYWSGSRRLHPQTVFVNIAAAVLGSILWFLPYICI